jgi:hypothetical protein
MEGVVETEDGYQFVGRITPYGWEYIGFLYQMGLDRAGEVQTRHTSNGNHGVRVDEGYVTTLTRDSAVVVAKWSSSAGLTILKAVRGDSAKPYKWYSTYGDSDTIEYQPRQVLEMADGGVLIYGDKLTGSAFYPPRSSFLVRTDSTGSVQWERAVTGVADQARNAKSIQQTRDGGFIATSYTFYADSINSRRHAFVILDKLDAEGSVQWQQLHTTPADLTIGLRVRQTADGGYIVVGSTAMYLPQAPEYNEDSYQYYMLRTDSVGRERWSKQWGSKGADALYDVYERSPGEFIVTGVEDAGYGPSYAGQLYLAMLRDLPSSVTGEDRARGVRATLISNPVSGSHAELAYSLPHASAVAIEVVDMLGRSVGHYREELQPIGEHRARFEVGGLASGRYMVRVVAADGVVSVPLVILR